MNLTQRRALRERQRTIMRVHLGDGRLRLVCPCGWTATVPAERRDFRGYLLWRQAVNGHAADGCPRLVGATS